MNEWLEENSVVDADVALMSKKGVITEFNIIEHAQGGFYITMRLNWRPELIHLATRRIRTEPRLFMDLGRLVKHIREEYPLICETKLFLLEHQRAAFDEIEAAKKKEEIKTVEPITDEKVTAKKTSAVAKTPKKN